MLNSSMSDETVTISKQEYERLQKLEADLPAMLETAKHQGGMDRLKMLNQKRKENPEKHRELSKKRYELKKDEILAKRREAYRLKKEAKQNSPGIPSERPEKSPDSQ